MFMFHHIIIIHRLLINSEIQILSMIHNFTQDIKCKQEKTEVILLDHIANFSERGPIL